MIKCGHCKERHATVTEVRQCSTRKTAAAAPAAPVVDKRIPADQITVVEVTPARPNAKTYADTFGKGTRGMKITFELEIGAECVGDFAYLYCGDGKTYHRIVKGWVRARRADPKHGGGYYTRYLIAGEWLTMRQIEVIG